MTHEIPETRSVQTCGKAAPESMPSVVRFQSLLDKQDFLVILNRDGYILGEFGGEQAARLWPACQELADKGVIATALYTKYTEPQEN